MPSAEPRYFIGLDLGTSECKACLVTDTGELIGTARDRYPTHTPEPGWAEQAPDDWRRGLTAATRQVLEQTRVPAARIHAIALTSAAHIGVLVDAHGVPVRQAILWNDQRATREVARLEADAGAEILRQTYQAVSTTWTLPHLLWVRTHDPGAWSRVRKVMLSKDYIACWLTGRVATDPATAVSSMLYDATASRWSPALCELASVAPEMLPKIIPATAPTGGLTAAAAGELGLRAGIPVVTGSLDSAAEMYAAGAHAPGQCLVRLATAGGIQRVVAVPAPNRRLITYPHLVTPLWYCQAGTNSCASAVRWGTQLLASESDNPFPAWDAAAAATPAGAEGLLFHPYLSGERAPLWDPQARGSFTGLSMQHGRGHLARAIYEGTALSIRHAISAFGSESMPAGPLRVVGGGTRSAVWLQILADVLAQDLVAAPEADSTYGAALLALHSQGGVPAHPPRVTGPVIHPIPAHAALYDAQYRRYVEIGERLVPLYH